MEFNNRVFGNLENSTLETIGVNTTDRGNKYLVQVPFGKMLYEKLTDVNGSADTNVVYGLSADKDLNGIVPEPILFINRITDATSKPIGWNTGSSSIQNITSYNRPANSLLTETINFGSEVDEFTESVKTDSLFAENYLNYISDLFNRQRRLVKVSAILPRSFLLNYSLADTLIINGKKYLINSIKTNLTTGKSELELFNKV